MTATITPTTTVPAPAPGASTLEELAAAHRPEQLVVLEALMDALTTSSAVTHLMVRGSLAAGTADRLSDLDLVVAVADNQLAEMLDLIDPLMDVLFGALLPGWPDNIVGNLGGTGRVYLLPHSGHLLQLDLYVCPASAAESLRQRTGARVLWQAPELAAATKQEQQAATQALAQLAARAPDCTALLVQAVVLHSMLRKRLLRGQLHIAFGLQHQLTETCRDIVRTVLVPHSAHHGWYHLSEIGRTSAGRACLRDLDAAIRLPAVPTLEQVDQGLERIVTIAERIAPVAVAALADELAAYRAYQHQEVTQ